MSHSLPTPKAFISYSWTSDPHVDWVVSLATRLTEDGVDVVLDKWDLQEGHDKYHFMEKMVTDPTVTRVLAVCDSQYAAKADARKGGVGTESQIISKEVYDKVDQSKFVPLIREFNDKEPCVPMYFKSRIYIDFSKADEFEASYEKLLRNLFGKPEHVKPTLGKPPSHILLDNAPSLVPARELDRLKDAVLNGKPHAHALIQDYLDSFTIALEDFRLKSTPTDWDAFDKAFDASIGGFVPFRDCFIEFVDFCASYLPVAPVVDRLMPFLESLAAFQFHPEGVTSAYEVQEAIYKFIVYELFLHAISSLIKRRAYELATPLLGGTYIYSSTHGGSEMYESGIAVFNQYNRYVDEVQTKRSGQNWISPVGQLIKTRATGKLSMRELAQIDVLLFLRRYFPIGGDRWMPRCAPYLGMMSTLELFARAPSTSGLEGLKILLGVSGIVDLWKSIERVLENKDVAQVIGSGKLWQVGIDLGRLMNSDRIGALAKKS